MVKKADAPYSGKFPGVKNFVEFNIKEIRGKNSWFQLA